MESIDIAPPEDWLTDLMNAPELPTNRNRLGMVLIQDEDENTAMSSHNPTQNASSSVAQVVQKPASGAVTTLSKRPPGACFQTLVTIEVGIEKKQFVIHKDLLTFYSDYFRGAFNGSFKESAEGKLSLLDVDVETFDIFHKFLYTGCLFDGEGHKLRSRKLIRLWLFGDQFIIPCFQNVVIDAILKRMDVAFVIPDITCIKLVWENTLRSAPLRKFMLDVQVYLTGVEESLSAENEQYWPAEAVTDLVKALNTEALFGHYPPAVDKTMPQRDRCYYHVHANGERCE